jgi:hypothetical protein
MTSLMLIYFEVETCNPASIASELLTAVSVPLCRELERRTTLFRVHWPLSVDRMHDSRISSSPGALQGTLSLAS